MQSTARADLIVLASGAFLALSNAGLAQWSADPAVNTAVATGPGEQVLPKLATTSDGGTYLGWFDNASGSYTVRMQRLDRDGVGAWGANGILVSANPQSTSLVDWDLIADSSGNCVLVFTDTRDGGDLDVFAYRVDRDGSLLWGANGVQLSINADYDPSPKVCETSTGDFVFAWSSYPSSGDGRARMQRLDPSGAPQLPAGGVTIAVATGESPAVTDVIASENGSVIVSWVRSIKTFASPRHLRARRFDANGTGAWASHVNVFDATSLPIAHWPRLESDGAGGAVTCWHRSDAGGTFNAFVQRLTATGSEVFAHNGVAVATTTTNHIDPDFAFDPQSAAITVFWNERNGAQSQWGIYGQRIDAAGSRVWGPGGKVYAPLDGIYEFLPRVVAYRGDVIVTWGDEPTGQFGKDRALATRVDTAGNSVWSGSPRVIGATPSTKSRLPTVIDCTGNVRAAWEDDRNGTPDIYLQAIHHDGSLGGAPSAWTDLGYALAGTLGAPSLAGDGCLCADSTATLSFQNVPPFSAFALIVGAAPTYANLLGGTLVPVPSLVVSGLVSGPASSFAVSGTWPAGIPSGVSLYFQAWFVDAGGPVGVSASNGLEATTP